jgi:hypothetical protein
MMDIAAASPPLGAAIGMALCAVALYMRRINPHGLYGLNPIFAIVFWVLGVVTIAVAGISFFHQKLVQYKRYRRSDSQRSMEDDTGSVRRNARK